MSRCSSGTATRSPSERGRVLVLHAPRVARAVIAEGARMSVAPGRPPARPRRRRRRPGPAGRPDTAGRLLGRLSVLPALLVMAWLLAGLPLLLLGHSRRCSR